MLNKDLFLNEKMFDPDAEVKATRDGFGTGMETKTGRAGRTRRSGR